MTPCPRSGIATFEAPLSRERAADDPYRAVHDLGIVKNLQRAVAWPRIGEPSPSRSVGTIVACRRDQLPRNGAHVAGGWDREFVSTPLFISFKARSLTPEQEKEVAQALAVAAKPHDTGEPLDWFDSLQPTRWKLLGVTVDFNWRQ